MTVRTYYQKVEFLGRLKKFHRGNFSECCQKVEFRGWWGHFGVVGADFGTKQVCFGVINVQKVIFGACFGKFHRGKIERWCSKTRIMGIAKTDMV